MLRTRIIMLLLVAGLIIFLFNLPRVVIENSESGLAGEVSGPSANPELSEEFLHNQEVSAEDAEIIISLKASIQKEENQEKTPTFADSLAELYLFYKKFDSAATYFERAAILDPGEKRWIKTGEAYYEAFTYAVDADMANYYGQKTREFFNPVIDSDPGRLDLKTKIGMTLVSS